MELADEAVADSQAGGADQFVLTEILMEDMVDRLILRRLKVPSYTKWRKQVPATPRGAAQPVHWGIDPSSALASLLPARRSRGQRRSSFGAGAQAEAFLLAAHDTEVTFLDEDRGRRRADRDPDGGANR